ncbi:MAG TPA: hypothetical protein VLM91_23180 [Candidatus Methylomirabilis sp.]|nr:hypothetical protein [Candidatus Methylomirabilis sp.]
MTTRGRARFPRAYCLGQYCLVSGEVPGTQGRGLQSIPSIPTYRSLTCGDDIDIVITANTENM